MSRSNSTVVALEARHVRIVDSRLGEASTQDLVLIIAVESSKSQVRDLEWLSELLSVAARGVGVELVGVVHEGIVPRGVGHEVVVLVDELRLVVQEVDGVVH